MNNDNRNFYTLISKTVFETFPVLSQFLEQRGPLYHPVPEGSPEGTEPELMTTENATLKQAWKAYKGPNAMELVRGFVITEDQPFESVDYENAEYISFGLDEVNMKEVLEIHTAFQQVPGATYVPILTHSEITKAIETGQVELL